jgi:hypothetical protein
VRITSESLSMEALSRMGSEYEGISSASIRTAWSSAFAPTSSSSFQ